MRLMNKAVAAGAEKEAEDAGVALSKSYEDVMEGLEKFIKGGTQAKDEKKDEKAGILSKSKVQQDDEQAETLAKAAKDLADKKEKDAAALAKSLETDGEKSEMDGVKVFAELKQTIREDLAKAITSMKRDIMQHVDERVAQIAEGQVLVAKALVTNGNLLKAAMHEVAVIGEQPRGRKSVLSVFDKAMSGDGGTEEISKGAVRIDTQKVMAKSLELNEQQKLTPSDVGVINHHVVGGMGIPAKYAHLFKAEEIAVSQ